MQMDQVMGVQIHWQGALLVYVWYVHLCGENIGDSKGKEELEAKSRRHEFVELDLVPLHKKPSLFQENGQLNGTER
jgi:hypothetical protein